MDSSSGHDRLIFSIAFGLCGPLLVLLGLYELFNASRTGLGHLFLYGTVTALGATLALCIRLVWHEKISIRRVELNWRTVQFLEVVLPLVILYHMGHNSSTDGWVRDFALQRGGQWNESYRFATYSLLHYNLGHLLNNIVGVVLWWMVLTPVLSVEWRWVCLGLGVIVGGMTSTALLGIATIGASAGVGALIGAALVGCIALRLSITWKATVLTLAFCNYWPVLTNSFADHVAHLAGCLSGAGLAVAGLQRAQSESKSLTPLLVAMGVRVLWWGAVLLVLSG